MLRNLAMVAVVAAVGLCAPAGGAVVYANSPPPGDAFSNAGGSNQGQVVGASGWIYNNVRNNGIAGINTAYARSGDGSARLQTTQGPGGASSKADIEYLPGAVNVGGNYYSTGVLGTLGSLNSLSYDWYRSSASINSAAQHPVIRLLTDADGNLGTTGDRGGLVFELAYNGVASAPVDTWVANDVFNFSGAGQSAKVWSFGNGQAFEFGGYRTIQEWVAGLGTVSGGTAVIGISCGVGSGWGPFDGAVDNVAFGFTGGIAGTYNFEVSQASGQPIPEPGTLSLLALGGVVVARRRRAR